MLDLITLIPALINLAGCSPDITPDTITAIIQVESSWDQSSRSRWGAVGLMQVTDVAVEDYNRRRGTSITLEDVGAESVINLLVGIDHLCQWKDLDRRGMVIAYWSGRRRYLQMERGEADYLLVVADRYYRKVMAHEDMGQLANHINGTRELLEPKRHLRKLVFLKNILIIP